MAFHANDPDRVALRRGIRAAIALPVALAVAKLGLDDTAGSLFAVLGTIGLLVSADFAGRTRQRLAAYATTGIVGSVVLAIGWAASGSTAVAVVVTFVVAFALGITAFLRGSVAVGTPAIMLVFVVSITVDAAPGTLGQYQLGWWCAVVICTITALLVLPRDSQAGLRRLLADAFEAAATAVRATWGADTSASGAAAVATFGERMDALDAVYGGQRPRLPGLTAHDQALELLGSQLDNVRLLLGEATGARPADLPVEHDLLGLEVSRSLGVLATAMRDGTTLPSGEPIDAARGALRDRLGSWVAQASVAGATPTQVAHQLSEQNPLRMCAVLVEQMTQVARVANQGELETLERQPPVPVRDWRRVLRSQLDLRSPWTHNALRTALGLTIAVLVVDLVGVEHGFWVLLGTISVLRFDASSTRKLAWRAIPATAVGALAGVLALFAFSDAPGGLWFLLPFMVFLAAWSGAALGFAAGQATFTALVLVALGVIDWPVPPGLALVRLEDVAIGVGVALVVAVLLWPRGAAGELRRRLAEATSLSGAYLGRALGAFATPDDGLAQARLAAILSVDRAVETIQLAQAQRGGPTGLAEWTTRASSTYVIVTSGRVIASLAPAFTALSAPPVLMSALAATREASDAHWHEIAGALAADREADAPTVPGVAQIDLSGLDLRIPAAAAAFVLAVWAIDWTAFVSRLHPGAPATPTPAPPT